MNWVVFAILSAISFGIYNFFVKLTGEKISPVVSLAFLTGTSFLFALLSIIFFKFSGQKISFSKNVILFPGKLYSEVQLFS